MGMDPIDARFAIDGRRGGLSEHRSPPAEPAGRGPLPPDHQVIRKTGVVAPCDAQFLDTA